MTILSSTAGWATGKDTDCLSKTIEYALQIELDNGNIQAAYQKWLAPATCPSTSARRSMVQGNELGYTGWRRKGGGGGAAGGAVTDINDAQLKVADLAGLLVVFAGFVLLVGALKLGRRTFCPVGSGEDKPDENWHHELRKKNMELQS